MYELLESVSHARVVVHHFWQAVASPNRLVPSQRPPCPRKTPRTAVAENSCPFIVVASLLVSILEIYIFWTLNWQLASAVAKLVALEH